MEYLKTNYVDDKLDTSKNQLRKYNMITNDDGTVSFVDVTTYTTQGTSFGAKDINDTNSAINQLNESLEQKVNSPTSINVLANWNANTDTTITLSDNISNYSFIIIGLRNNSSNVVFNSTTIPADVFKNVSYSQGCRAYIAGNDIQATARYLSDNSITAGGNALSSSYSGVIFGVK